MKFLKLSPNGSLGIAAKPIGKETFCTMTMLLYSVGIMLSPSQVVPHCEEITTIYFFIQIFNV
jgi:hypothetical protein